MKVIVPSPLHAYTGGRRELEAAGDSLAQVLDDLDRRHPGLRFRVVDEQGAVRPHIRFFVNGADVRALATPLAASDELVVVAALSGG